MKKNILISVAIIVLAVVGFVVFKQSSTTPVGEPTNFNLIQVITSKSRLILNKRNCLGIIAEGKSVINFSSSQIIESKEEYRELPTSRGGYL